MKRELQGMGGLALLAALGCAGGDRLGSKPEGSAPRSDLPWAGGGDRSANGVEVRPPEPTVIGGSPPEPSVEGSNTNWRPLEPELVPVRRVLRRAPRPWDPELHPRIDPFPPGGPRIDPESNGARPSPIERSADPDATDPLVDDPEATPEPASADEPSSSSSGASDPGED